MTVLKGKDTPGAMCEESVWFTCSKNLAQTYEFTGKKLECMFTYFLFIEIKFSLKI